MKPSGFVDSLDRPFARLTALAIPVCLRLILLDLERWLEAPRELEDGHAEAQ